MDEKEIEEMDRYMYIKGNYRTLVLLLSVSVSFVFFDTLWSMDEMSFGYRFISNECQLCVIQNS